MAYDETIVAGTVSKIIEVCLRDSTTGQGKTGLAHSAVTARYVREGGTATTITLSAGTAGDSYSSGKWAQVDATNMRGVYQFHVPNAALASGARAVTITFQAAGTLDKQIRICLVAVDQYDAVRAGLTALPNVAANAVGGLPVLDAASTVPANVTRFGGTAGTFASGRPEVNATHWGGTAVGSANVRANIVQVAGQTANASASVSFPASIGTSTLDAAGVRLAVGLASANLDTQLSSIPTAAANATAVRSELTTELGRIDVSISSRLPTASYTAPATVAAIASEVDTVLTAAHGSGSWQTGTGGGTDWTADERAAIRAILGVPLSGTTPVIPTEGVLDAIRDQVLPLTYTVPNRVDASATVTVGPETVDEIAEGVVGRLGSATVRLVSPLTPDGGLITILRGDDYHAADRQVYEWTEEAAGWPVLTGASIELRLNESGPVIAGSVLVDTGSAKKVRVEITRAQSLTAQSGIFRLVAILHPSGREVTLKRGKVITLW